MEEMRPGFYFPEEIIFMILSWLPVMSLLRFRSVCKLWRSMISSPKMIDTHLTNSHKRQASVFKFSNEENSFYIDTRDASVMLHLPPRLFGISICSANGLICLTNLRGDMYLWNPLTKQAKILPAPKKLVPLHQLIPGLCFDSISNDYKLLRIVTSRLPSHGFTCICQAELYSANANSWKEIQIPYTVRSFIRRSGSKCVYTKTGVLYMDGGNEILSFDSHNEVFEVYRIPNSLNLLRKSHFLDYEGSVAIILLESVCGRSVFSLWTLDDVCDKISWMKKFNLEADPAGICNITLYLGVGQYVAQTDHGGYVFYDSTKKENNKFPLTAIEDSSDLTSVIKYNDSLVSLEGFEQLDDNGIQG